MSIQKYCVYIRAEGRGNILPKFAGPLAGTILPCKDYQYTSSNKCISMSL